MEHELAAFKVIYDVEIDADKLLGLFEDVASAARPNEEEIIDSDPELADILVEGDEIDRIAIGVENIHGELIGYAAATIDDAEMHAIADCIVVHPDERRQNLAKLMIERGMSRFNMQGVTSISCQIFGELQKLMPHLVRNYGFTYNELNEEYFLDNLPWVLTQQSISSEDTPLTGQSPKSVELEDSSPPISDEEIIQFKDRVEKLVKASARYATMCALSIDNYDWFLFDMNGQEIVLSYTPVTDYGYGSWYAVEYDIAELVASPEGLKMVKERYYDVGLAEDDNSLGFPSFRQVHEIQSSDKSVRPFAVSEENVEETFTQNRYKHIMTILDKLSPEHLVEMRED